ncbi:MAG: hypothetical protein ACO3WK_13515 [Steroidobacteraceae bacterium]
MLFPTLTFHLFFIAVFLGIWAVRDNEWRKILLLLASWIFYGAWDWRFVALLIASGILNSGAARLILWTREEGSDEARQRLAKPIFIFGIIANLAILGFFKYYGFFLEQVGEVLYSLGWERDLTIMSVIRPVKRVVE